MRMRTAALVCVVCAGALEAQGPPAGFTVTPLVDNATVAVARLRLAPGAREQPHTHPYSMVVVYLTDGDVELHNEASRWKGRRARGEVDFIARDATHAAANVGESPIDVVAISIKADRVPAGSAPADPAPAGITRTAVLETADATVARVDFAPVAREPIHTHPYDLVVVPLTSAEVEVRMGGAVDKRVYQAGDLFFLPRNEPHAMANLASGTFSVLGVAIK